MINKFNFLIVLVLLGLGAAIYFMTRGTPTEEIDPLENVSSELVEPPKAVTKPVPVADELDIEAEVKSKPETEDEPVKPTPTTTPAKPLVSAKSNPVSVATGPRKRRLTLAELNIFLDKIDKNDGPGSINECYADIFKRYFNKIVKGMQFDEETISKMLDPNRKLFFPIDPEGSLIKDGYLPNEILPEYKKIYPKIREEIMSCPRPGYNPPPKSSNTNSIDIGVPPMEKRLFRMGWPDGTRWNIKGTTGNDTQKCNDICKSLGYNYFTHNPPPHDGGCGCSRSNLKLSELKMTDHVNAKTRRVV